MPSRKSDDQESQESFEELTDAGKRTILSGGHSVIDVGCLLDSHNDCDKQHCQIVQVGEAYQSVTAKQIRIAEITAITGLVVSTVFDLALIAVWLHHAWGGAAMPDVPWFIISIATATHAAGGFSALKLPRKHDG